MLYFDAKITTIVNINGVHLYSSTVLLLPFPHYGNQRSGFTSQIIRNVEDKRNVTPESLTNAVAQALTQ